MSQKKKFRKSTLPFLLKKFETNFNSKKSDFRFHASLKLYKKNHNNKDFNSAQPNKLLL